MKKMLVLIFAGFLTVAVTACGSAEDSSGNAGNGGSEGAAEHEGSTLDRILEEGKVKVGIANEKPYGYEDEDGNVTGEGPEIAKAIFKKMGVEQFDAEIVEFGSLIPGLQAERFDLVTAGMDIRPERCEQALFSEPEIRYGEGMIVQAGNPLDLHSYEDIAANPDVKVSVMAGANQHDYLRELGVQEDQIETSDSISSNISAVASGRVDATTMTEATAREAVETADDSVELVDDFEQPIIDGENVMAYGAAAFRQGDEELRDAYNEHLKEMEESGELLEILEQFGFSEDNLPDGTTTADRCGG